jgi:hypothetical protein
MADSSRRRRSTFFVAPPLPPSSNSNSNLLMMEELDIEGDGNIMTASEVQVPTNDDSSSASHSRTSVDSSSSSSSSSAITGPSSSKSGSNDPISPPLIPLPLNLKSEIPIEDSDVPRATMFNRQNSASPMLPLPKKEKHPGRGHQQQQQLQQHFLHGINVESCQNLLSIPDPPTPGKVNHRRQSSPGPMLQPLPFDDLTYSSKANRQKIPKQAYMHADDSKVSMRSKQKPKRPRKSLSHIPSPSLPTDFDPLSRRRSDDDMQEKSTTDTAAESSHEAFNTTATTLPGAHTATLQIADDIENSNADASVTKRRKKRQSIVLPSDTTTGTQEYFSTFMTYKKAPPTAQEEEQTSATTSSMEQRPTAVSPQDLQELRKLVRSYTSLSFDARNSCQEIQRIRERTGYVLTPPLTCSDDLLHADLNLDDSLNENGKESLKESKMKLLVKMGPQLQRMDEKKVEQVKNTQHATDCFVEKKRGRYLYYDVSSNRPIAPHVYEQRYLLMLQDTHKIRSREWTQHLQQATHVVPEADHQSNMKASAGQESPLEMRDDVYVNYDDNDNLHESMDICETSASFILGGDLIDDSSDMNTNTNTSMNPCDTSKGSDVGQEIEIVLDEKGEYRALPAPFCMTGTAASPGSDSESSVLPLPSREEESSDPEYAQAEQKLWGAIDTALEEYSRDILAIQTARRMGVSSKVST